MMFYCGKVTGKDFSIEEWNKAFDYCIANNITGVEADKILNPEKFPCEKQCFDCMADVGERQAKTKLL